MRDLLLLIAFIFAIAIGWCLGRHAAKGKSVVGAYYRGLDRLLESNLDASAVDAVEVLVKTLDISQGDAETHLAIGRLFRSKGEIDKATKIHQRLLAQPDLSKAESLVVQFELAKDYMSAGLLDRAERLLNEVAESSDDLKWSALQLLLEIYQREKEWDKATTIARQLLPKKQGKIREVLAHYRCEVAIEKITVGDVSGACRELKQALSFDKNCVRASLLRGQVEFQRGNFKDAIKALQRVKDQDPDYLPESVPELTQCYKAVGKEWELERYLRECLDYNPSITLVFAVADILKRDDERKGQVNAFISEQLCRRPSLRGIRHLLGIQAGQVPAKDSDYLRQLYSLTSNLIESKPVYRCSCCGYSGKHLSWLCPSCRKWGGIKPIYGLEGE